LNLERDFFVGILIFLLNQTCAESEPQGLCHVAFVARKKLCVSLFDLVPRYAFCFLDLAVLRIELHPCSCSEICQSKLMIREFIHCPFLQMQVFLLFSAFSLAFILPSSGDLAHTCGLFALFRRH
jgi:hypothetical protein